MAPNLTGVGERIRRERERAGLSLAGLSELSGLSKAYLVKLESPAGNPSLDVLRRIADALDLTIADLVDGPVFRFNEQDAEIPTSLRAFADEAGLMPSETRTLASIRWRRGQEPRSRERWRYIYDSLRLSQSMDENEKDEG